MGNDLSLDNEALRLQRDQELPYNSSYNMSQPIGTLTTDMLTNASRSATRIHNNIGQITTVSEAQYSSVDMSDIKRLANIPRFLPLLHNYLDLAQLRRLNSSLDQDLAPSKTTDQYESSQSTFHEDKHLSLFSHRQIAQQGQFLKSKPLGLNHRPVLDLCKLCENVLKNSAETIDSDQTCINTSIRQMDMLIHNLHTQMSEQRSNLFRITEQISKVGDMLVALERAHATIGRIKPLLNQINNNLP